jgi:hypothetical protein
MIDYFSLLGCSRYLALIFAIGLGIGEVVINWGNWQYAPMWIIDCIIIAWLLWGFAATRLGGHIHILLTAWAFTAGVFYMALFVSLDPQIAAIIKTNTVLLELMGLMLIASLIGLLCAWLAHRSLNA